MGPQGPGAPQGPPKKYWGPPWGPFGPPLAPPWGAYSTLGGPYSTLGGPFVGSLFARVWGPYFVWFAGLSPVA